MEVMPNPGANWSKERIGNNTIHMFQEKTPQALTLWKKDVTDFVYSRTDTLRDRRILRRVGRSVKPDKDPSLVWCLIDSREGDLKQIIHARQGHPEVSTVINDTHTGNIFELTYQEGKLQEVGFRHMFDYGDTFEALDQETIGSKLKALADYYLVRGETGTFSPGSLDLEDVDSQ